MEAGGRGMAGRRGGRGLRTVSADGMHLRFKEWRASDKGQLSMIFY